VFSPIKIEALDRQLEDSRLFSYNGIGGFSQYLFPFGSDQICFCSIMMQLIVSLECLFVTDSEVESTRSFVCHLQH